MGKLGIYCWINKVNGKIYVGSSVNLRKRFVSYFNINYIIISKMLISKVLIKYGYVEFFLEILEYCDFLNIILRE